MGFRTGASVAAWLAVAGTLIQFTLALTWIAVIAGLSAKTVDGASAFSYPLIFLPFISSAFVLTDSMPGPVWVHILRYQLHITETEFWACINDGMFPKRSSPEVPTAAVPLAVVRQLIDKAGRSEEEVAAMTKEQAVKALSDFWMSQPPDS
jgi:hypothetical protein